MIPRPPFPGDLTLEEEIARFSELEKGLPAVWDLLIGRQNEPFTSVVVPSLTLDPAELRKLEGASL